MSCLAFEELDGARISTDVDSREDCNATANHERYEFAPQLGALCPQADHVCGKLVSGRRARAAPLAAQLRWEGLGALGQHFPLQDEKRRLEESKKKAEAGQPAMD